MSARSRFLTLIALATSSALALVGCGKSGSAAGDDHDHAHEAKGEHAHEHDEKPGASDDHDHDHEPDHDAEKKDEHGHDHGDEEAGGSARFEAGRGLALAPETVTAIGLTTARVESRPLAATAEITATVFDAGSPARASALAPLAIADAFASDPRVLAVHRDTLNALGQVELIVAAPASATVGATFTLELRTPARETLSVPRAAVLRTATGVFVYVQHGEHWLRTPVTAGASEGEFTAITDGLAAGDTVAATAVEHLWLTELRLTKGGGHSH